MVNDGLDVNLNGTASKGRGFRCTRSNLHARATLFLNKVFKSLLRILVGVPVVSLIAGGVLLLAFGVTLRGRSVGLSAVVFGGVIFCSVGYWDRPWFKRIRRLFCAVLLPTGLLLFLVPLMTAPDGGTREGPVQNRFLHGQGAFPRYSPWNVIPEIDQLAAGVRVMRFRDGSLAQEADRLRSLVPSMYDAMDADTDFRNLGSVLGMGYRELVGLEFRSGHYYAFLPETTGGRKLPCLVFLHGLGGNTKSCLWVLSRQNRCAVIAPTFGIGNWDKPGGAECVVEVVREAVATLPLDPGSVFLMGYSNGALGVTRALVKAPGLFRGLIYLSPVTEDELFSTKEFSSRSRDCPILFLHGGRDVRIPRAFVEGTAACLRRAGFDVRLKVFDDEDHYLIFSQPQAVLDEVLAFMTATCESR